MERTTLNLEMKMYILNRLFDIEYTSTYGFGIRDNGLVKVAIVENADDILPMITYCEPNSKSHGGVYGVRMWNNKKAFEIIKEYAREEIIICSVKEFEAEYKEAKENGFNGNRGNFLEYKFASVTGAKLNDNPNAKLTDCGDAVLNGEHIQLKLWNATVTTETTMNNLLKANKTA